MREGGDTKHSTRTQKEDGERGTHRRQPSVHHQHARDADGAANRQHHIALLAVLAHQVSNGQVAGKGGNEADGEVHQSDGHGHPSETQELEGGGRGRKELPQSEVRRVAARMRKTERSVVPRNNQQSNGGRHDLRIDADVEQQRALHHAATNAEKTGNHAGQNGERGEADDVMAAPVDVTFLRRSCVRQ